MRVEGRLEVEIQLTAMTSDYKISLSVEQSKLLITIWTLSRSK